MIALHSTPFSHISPVTPANAFSSLRPSSSAAAPTGSRRIDAAAAAQQREAARQWLAAAVGAVAGGGPSPEAPPSLLSGGTADACAANTLPPRSPVAVTYSPWVMPPPRWPHPRDADPYYAVHPHPSIPPVVPISAGGEVIHVGAKTLAKVPSSALYQMVRRLYTQRFGGYRYNAYGGCAYNAAKASSAARKGEGVAVGKRRPRPDCRHDVGGAATLRRRDDSGSDSEGEDSKEEHDAINWDDGEDAVGIPTDSRGRLLLDADPRYVRFLINRLRGYSAASAGDLAVVFCRRRRPAAGRWVGNGGVMGEGDGEEDSTATVVDGGDGGGPLVYGAAPSNNNAPNLPPNASGAPPIPPQASASSSAASAIAANALLLQQYAAHRRYFPAVPPNVPPHAADPNALVAPATAAAYVASLDPSWSSNAAAAARGGRGGVQLLRAPLAWGGAAPSHVVVPASASPSPSFAAAAAGRGVAGGAAAIGGATGACPAAAAAASGLTAVIGAVGCDDVLRQGIVAAAAALGLDELLRDSDVSTINNEGDCGSFASEWCPPSSAEDSEGSDDDGSVGDSEDPEGGDNGIVEGKGEGAGGAPPLVITRAERAAIVAARRAELRTMSTLRCSPNHVCGASSSFLPLSAAAAAVVRGGGKNGALSLSSSSVAGAGGMGGQTLSSQCVFGLVGAPMPLLGVSPLRPPPAPPQRGQHRYEASFFVRSCGEGASVGIGVVSAHWARRAAHHFSSPAGQGASDASSSSSPFSLSAAFGGAEGCACYGSNGRVTYTFGYEKGKGGDGAADGAVGAEDEPSSVAETVSEVTSSAYGAGCVITVVVDSAASRIHWEIGGAGALRYTEGAYFPGHSPPPPQSARGVIGGGAPAVATALGSGADADTAGLPPSSFIAVSAVGTRVPTAFPNAAQMRQIVEGRVVAVAPLPSAHSKVVGATPSSGDDEGEEALWFAVAVEGGASVSLVGRPTWRRE